MRDRAVSGDELDDELRKSFPWVGRLPSGRPGIAQIRLALDLLLHVRLSSPEHFPALLAAVR
jgi:hypothetical protein